MGSHVSLAPWALRVLGQYTHRSQGVTLGGSSPSSSGPSVPANIPHPCLAALICERNDYNKKVQGRGIVYSLPTNGLLQR